MKLEVNKVYREKEKMTTRLDYVAWDEISEIAQRMLKVKFKELESVLELNFREGREKEFALTKLEECWMWVGKAIKVDQVQREKEA